MRNVVVQVYLMIFQYGFPTKVSASLEACGCTYTHVRFRGEEDMVLLIVLLKVLLCCSGALLGQVVGMGEARGEHGIEGECFRIKHHLDEPEEMSLHMRQ